MTDTRTAHLSEYLRWVLGALSEEQREAVMRPPGEDVLVIAGAGTGKTRLLTARVAWIATHGVGLRRILVTTFTNRAARELEQRLERIIGAPREGEGRIATGTYHSVAARLIRDHAETLSELLEREPPLTADYSILDETDASKLLRDAARPQAWEGLDPKLGLLARDADWLLRQREKFLRVVPDSEKLAEMADTDDVKFEIATPARGKNEPERVERSAATLFRRYEQLKRTMNALDYSDLICLAVQGLEMDAQLAPSYDAVLADEYQDTDSAQERMLQALRANPRGGAPSTLFCVGDPDQLIFGWRGAKIENILDMAKRHGAAVRQLTESFRSPPAIIETANAALRANVDRVEKTLRSSIAPAHGTSVIAEEWASAQDEARATAGRIAQAVRKEGRDPGEFAVLARTARAFSLVDGALARATIPYRVTAGRQLGSKAEVRDVAAWIRVLLNARDDAAAERCLLREQRSGFGPTSADKARVSAEQDRMPMIDAAAELALRGAYNNKAAEHAQAVHGHYSALLALLDQRASAARMVGEIIETTGIGTDARRDLAADDPDLRDNARECVRMLDDLRVIGADHPSLRSLGEHLAIADTRADAPPAHCVTVSTIHQAKGLEWDEVFIVGVENEVFPSGSERTRSPAKLEEERRCLHVAITRARKRCILSWSRWRHAKEAERSPFIAELGDTVALRVHETPRGADRQR